MQLQQFLLWNKANIKHICKSQLYNYYYHHHHHHHLHHHTNSSFHIYAVGDDGVNNFDK